MEYLEKNTTIKNREAREITHIRQDYQMKSIFGRMVDADMIEQVPNTSLGFHTREPLSVLQEGKPLDLRFAGYDVRLATETDAGSAKNCHYATAIQTTIFLPIDKTKHPDRLGPRKVKSLLFLVIPLPRGRGDIGISRPGYTFGNTKIRDDAADWNSSSRLHFWQHLSRPFSIAIIAMTASEPNADLLSLRETTSRGGWSKITQVSTSKSLVRPLLPMNKRSVAPWRNGSRESHSRGRRKNTRPRTGPEVEERRDDKARDNEHSNQRNTLYDEKHERKAGAYLIGSDPKMGMVGRCISDAVSNNAGYEGVGHNVHGAVEGDLTQGANPDHGQPPHVTARGARAAKGR